MIIPQENKKMFNSIADGYDLTNNIITLGFHKSWYRLIVKKSNLSSGSRALDCATGTGNVAIAFKEHFGNSVDVTAVDVAENMLKLASEKASNKGIRIGFIQCDILEMPFENNKFDVSTISFGIRNTESIEKCLIEMARVVKPGGKVIILETGNISGISGMIFSVYQKIFVGNIGKYITKNESAYKFFVESSNRFPSGKEFLKIMDSTGVFSKTEFQKQMLGTIFLYTGIVD
jgi:demethylmenaquinone methyltransferase/2-methoxy-6-polyprenyl-1,4-benzoquinol methylase